MAIFRSKRDRAAVPILIQLAQIDGGNPSELDHALGLLTAGILTFTRKDAEILRDSLLEKVAVLCDVVRRSLLWLAKTPPGIPADCAVWMNEAEPSEIMRLDLTEGSDKYLDGDSVNFHGTEPINLLDLEYQPWRYSNAGFIEREAARELSNCVALARAVAQADGGNYIVLCPECRNPMYRPDHNRIYCSFRCADRVGHRKRRKEKENGAANVAE